LIRMYHYTIILFFISFLFFFLMIRRPPRSTLFPTRRSSDLSKEQVASRPVWLLRGQPFPGTFPHSLLPGAPPAYRIRKTLPCSCASDPGCTCASIGSCPAFLPCSRSKNTNRRAPPPHHWYRSTHNR